MNRFEATAALGYENLVPIIPPDAPISERSSLYKRVGTRQDARGKTPGLKGRDGLWYGFDWIKYQADDTDWRRWHEMGAGVGIRTGDGLLAIDADTTDETHARTIKDAVERHIGWTPIRVGRFPKALYLIRVSEPMPYQRIEFGPEDEAGRNRIWRVELLTEGRQFVAFGRHPVTGKGYSWPRELIPFADLPVVDPATIAVLLADLRETLPDCGDLIREGAAATVNQESLRGDPDIVRKAVQATPNTHAMFPSREAYRDFGYAIKAALPDDPDEAWALWSEWCDQWEGPNGETNDPDVAAADWHRMKPPFKRGASWLYEIADQTSDGAFSVADAWFTDLEEDRNPFETIAAAEERTRSGDLFPVLTIDAIRNRPPAEWLIDRHLPKHGVGFLYSQPGAGKSFLALDMALHIASGADSWHGDAIRPGEQPRVLYIAAEGAYGFRNRIDAWTRQYPDHGDMREAFFLIEQTINFMDAEDIEKLARTVRSVGPVFDLVIVDTVSRAMPGADENLQKDMTRFIQACDAVRTVSGGVVLGVHHAGKNGDMRGSTVLLGAGDFVFRLDRNRGATVGRLTCDKQKEAPDGWEEPYEFSITRLDGDETSLVVTRCDVGVGPSAELTPALASQVLEAMRAAWAAGEPWSRAAQSGERRATRRLIADFGFTAERADDMLNLWQQMGLIEYRQQSARLKRKGYCVLVDAERAALLAENGPSTREDIFG